MMGDSYNHEVSLECLGGSARSKRIICLGIESSANKVGVGIVDGDGNILSNRRKTYITPPGTGFLPRETAEHHQRAITGLVNDSLSEAQLSPRDLTCIAYTMGPGMGAPLSVGAIMARTLAMIWEKPVIAVNHCVAHIEMGRLVTKCNNPVVLYVSGGNTQVIGYSAKRYRILGETLDMAIGNCIDRVARLLHLPNYPAPGFQVEKLAESFRNGFDCQSNPLLLPLPYCVKGMDMSFSGILSRIEDIVRYAENAGYINGKGEYTDDLTGCSVAYRTKQGSKVNTDISELDEIPKALFTPASLCYSFQEHLFAMLVEITERAMALGNSSDVLVVGGVGCNRRLQEMLKSMAENRGCGMGGMDDRYCIDNGAMIAYLGTLMFKQGQIVNPLDTFYCQRYRTDDVIVKWRE